MSRNKFFSTNTLDPYDNVPVRKEKRLSKQGFEQTPLDNNYTLVRAPKQRKQPKQRMPSFMSNNESQQYYNMPPPQPQYQQFNNTNPEQSKMLILEDENGHEITRIHPTESSAPSIQQPVSVPMQHVVYPNYPQPVQHVVYPNYHIPHHPYAQPNIGYHIPQQPQPKSNMLVLEDENGHEITRILPSDHQSQYQPSPHPGFFVHPGAQGWY